MGNIFSRAISLGVTSELSRQKKIVLKIVNVDAIGSFIAYGFYSVATWTQGHMIQSWICGLLALINLSCLYLLHRRHYDLARILIHQSGVWGIFMSSDSYGLESGFQYYYLVQVLMPHISFTVDEFVKVFFLSGMTCVVLLMQEFLGTGLIFSPLPAPPGGKETAVVIVICFIFIVLSIGKWIIYQVYQDIQKQQKEVIQASNMIAIGEMSSGIAHEINNPLQTLALQLLVVKDKSQNPHLDEDFNKMENIIVKMGKMVHGLKYMARPEAESMKETFEVSKVIHDALEIAQMKIQETNAFVQILGEVKSRSFGNPVQITQVIINLLNNALDAVALTNRRWINIEVSEKDRWVEIAVTDSGPGIAFEIAHKVMTPFFTTKGPAKGTGLGLAISKNLLEINDGRIYHDDSSPNTRFVVLIPLVK